MKLHSTLLVSALALSLCGAAWTHAAQGGVPATGTRIQTQSFFATHTEELGESVVLDLNLSLLPQTRLEDGALVRPLAARAIFEMSVQGVSAAYLGESRSHLLRPAASAEPIDLSISGLDLAVHAQGAAEGAARSYSVLLFPVAGKNWGEVADFKDDVVVLASRR